jgi:cytochrome c-type biogenesis protein CcmH
MGHLTQVASFRALLPGGCEQASSAASNDGGIVHRLMEIGKQLLNSIRILGFLALAGLAAAADPEVQLDAAQKALYQTLCQSLIAPCCWRESVAIHRSPASLEVRDEIATMIVEGKSQREILDDFVGRYGARVLIEPEGSRAQWLYVIPILVLLIASFAAVRFLLRRTRRGRLPGPPAAAIDDSEWDW